MATTGPGLDFPKPGLENPKPGLEIPNPGLENPKPGLENPKPGLGQPGLGLISFPQAPFSPFGGRVKQKGGPDVELSFIIWQI